ncbi:MAG: hypothetical protein ACI94Y_001772 [Maribacter sp.]|jgi:hypothetical protein
MLNSKIILLLQSFSSQEFREFSKFLYSPFFNKKKEVILMYEVLKKASPDFDQHKIGRHFIMKKVYPKLAFEEKKYKYLSNLLLKLAERYISLKETESRAMIQEYHLMNAYVKRGLDKNYNFIYNKAQALQENSLKRDSNFYYRAFLLKNVAAEHFDKKKVRKNNLHLEQLTQTLDIYYLANKLKYTCHILNNNKFISGNNTQLPSEIIQLLNRNDFSNYPAIHLYFNLYQLMTEENEVFFSEVKKLLNEYQQTFEKEELKEIYYYLINYCITQLVKNKNTDYYLLELYGMYQKGIESELLLEDGFISPWTFKNVIKIGLRLEKFDETASFVELNKIRLKPKFRTDAYHYSMAELFYKKKDLNKSIRHLNNVDYSDIYYILGAKKLLLKIYYETDEYDALESLLNSFQTYLKRNKLISEDNREIYLNFTKCLNKIIKDQNNKFQLKEQIENTSPLTDKNWLLQIIQK